MIVLFTRVFVELYCSYTVQLNLNVTHAYTYTRVSARLTRVKLQKLACTSTTTRGFVVRTSVIKHLWHTRHTPHEQTRYERTTAQITI